MKSSFPLFAVVAFTLFTADMYADGFYRAEKDGSGGWRLVDPAGRPTVWLGVDHVKYKQAT